MDCFCGEPLLSSVQRPTQILYAAAESNISKNNDSDNANDSSSPYVMDKNGRPVGVKDGKLPLKLLILVESFVQLIQAHHPRINIQG